MPIALILAEFKASIAQCDSLIANGHKLDASGSAILPTIDQQQITVAAFLNLFIAWEAFLEKSLTEFMIGGATISSNKPVRYVSPPHADAAIKLVIGVMRFFDFANHKNVKMMINMYFKDGYPYEPHISGIYSDLDDLRTMRNASAHISTTTQTALEGLGVRIFGQPQGGITLYKMLTATDPRSAAGETVYLAYRNKLEVTAELISQG